MHNYWTVVRLIASISLGLIPFTSWAGEEPPPCQFSGEEEVAARPECYSIGAITFTGVKPMMPPIQSPSGTWGSPADVESVFKILREVWKVVEANRPVLEMDLPLESAAIPAAAKDWTDIELPGMPRAYNYGVSAKNLMGVEVVGFDYSVQFVPGGSFQGKGKYLMNVKVVPTSVRVKWGFKFNVDAQVPTAINFGTKADPIAGIQLILHWRMESVLVVNDGSKSFVIGGDGRFGELGPKALQLKLQQFAGRS